VVNHGRVAAAWVSGGYPGSGGLDKRGAFNSTVHAWVYPLLPTCRACISPGRPLLYEHGRVAAYTCCAMNKPWFGAREMRRAAQRAGGLWTLSDIAHFTGTKRTRQWANENDDFPEPAYRNMLGHRFYCGYEICFWLTETGRLAQARDLYEAIVRWNVRNKTPGRPRTSGLYP